MTYNASRLHDVRETDRSVKVGNGATMKASSIGKMKAIVRNEAGEEITTTINEVVHVPGLLCNLLSVGKLREHGSVVYDKKGAKLELSDKKGKTIPFSKVEGMEVFGLELRRDEVAHVVLPREKPVPAKKAQEILGHIGNDATRKTMNYWGWKVSRGSHFCESCAVAKAKQKNVVKVRKDKGAEKPGERLYIDISSVSKKSAGGKKFWALIVDDATRMKWSRFLTKKDELAEKVMPLVRRLNATGRTVRYVRMDNAGENLALADELREIGVTVEFVAPNTPQQNGVVERAFATCTARGRAMMLNAGLSESLKGKLWAECFSTATTLSNLVPFKNDNEDEEVPPFRRFYGKEEEPKWLRHMRTFGELGFAANRVEIKSKLADRSHKVMFLGYAEEHDGDCYRLYKIGTKRVILSRDVRWADKMMFEMQEKKNSTQSTNDDAIDLEVKMKKMRNDDDTVKMERNADESANANGEEEDVFDVTTDDGGENTSSTQDTTGTSGSSSGTSDASERSLRPRTGIPLADLLEARAIHCNLENVEIALVSAVTLGVGELTRFCEAVNGNDGEKWKNAMKTEYMNITEKDVWKRVKRNDMRAGASSLDTKWVYKIKSDGRYRARLVVKRYTQIPGVDFTESHSPVPNNTTICTVLAHAALESWVAEQIDVETAFLYGELEEEIYLAKPEG